MTVAGRKGGRSRAARRSAQPECCGGAGAARRCKSRLTAPDPSSPAKPVRLPARAEADTKLDGESPVPAPRAAVDETAAVEGPRRRSVSFDLEAGTQHEITPYAEIYGLHPSEFLFERHGFVVLLADGDVGCYSPDGGEDPYEDWDEDEEEDDEDMEEDAGEDSWVVVQCG